MAALFINLHVTQTTCRVTWLNSCTLHTFSYLTVNLPVFTATQHPTLSCHYVRHAFLFWNNWWQTIHAFFFEHPIFQVSHQGCIVIEFGKALFWVIPRMSNPKIYRSQLFEPELTNLQLPRLVASNDYKNVLTQHVPATLSKLAWPLHTWAIKLQASCFIVHTMDDVIS